MVFVVRKLTSLLLVTLSQFIIYRQEHADQEQKQQQQQRQQQQTRPNTTISFENVKTQQEYGPPD